MPHRFAALRDQFPMDVRKREVVQPSTRTAADIVRILAIWREGRERFGSSGNFLCGTFGIVDAFWCPVAYRFRSYGVALSPLWQRNIPTCNWNTPTSILSPCNW